MQKLLLCYALTDFFLQREGMNTLIVPNRLSKESKSTQEENAQYSSLKLTLNEVIKDIFNTRNTEKKKK